MKKRTFLIPALCLLLALAAGVTAYAAANYGSQEDPLITKSYLDEVIQPELERILRSELEKAAPGGTAAENQTTATGTFELVTLSVGQQLVGTVGTELLLRSGSAQSYAYDRADVALVDTTSAASILNGAVLAANHLYMVSIAGNGITASSNNTRVLVCGEYSVQ